VLFVNADGTNGFNCTAPVSNVITCTGDMPGGGDTTITVSLATLLSLVPPTDLTLTATIDPTDVAHPSGFFIESNEGNNSATEVTTVTGSACVGCVDLVATQLVADPGYTGFGVTTQTFTAQVVNVGDTATALNPATQPLVDFVVTAQTGSFSVGSLTLSDPAFAPLCTITLTPSVPGPPVPPFTQIKVSCKGNLGPAQGLTLTIPVSSVTGDMSAYVFADPSDLINLLTTPQEFTEGNNILIVTVIHF
jgi:copper chaperone CopZ